MTYLEQDYLADKLAGRLPLINRHVDLDTGKIIERIGTTTRYELFEEYTHRRAMSDQMAEFTNGTVDSKKVE